MRVEPAAGRGGPDLPAATAGYHRGMAFDDEKLTKIVERFAHRHGGDGVHLAVEHVSSGERWVHGDAQAPLILSSITKMYTATVLVRLAVNGIVALTDPIGEFFDAATIRGIHLLRGEDSSARVTVGQLLAHTSGIADYLHDRRNAGGTLVDDVFRQDRGWHLDEALDTVRRELRPHFAPGTPGRAVMSSTDYLLAGRIIETLTGRSWAEAVERHITEPLALTNTWALGPGTMHRAEELPPLRDGERSLRIPQALASSQGHGALISTPADAIGFIRAFNDGRLLPRARVGAMQENWNRVIPPLRYGTGLMRYAVPRALAAAHAPHEFIGHAGGSGSFLFVCPGHDLVLAGTINRVRSRTLPFRLMSRVAAAAAAAVGTPAPSL